MILNLNFEEESDEEESSEEESDEDESGEEKSDNNEEKVEQVFVPLDENEKSKVDSPAEKIVLHQKK